MPEIKLYDVSVGVFSKGTIVTLELLKKATTHADASTFPSATLIEDMKPLSFHVQAVWNTTTGSLKRLKLQTMENWEDENPYTMEQLIARMEELKKFLDGITRETVEGSGTVETKLWGAPCTGEQFILSLGMPNLFFHLQTVYCILRMKGVPLGKDDYLPHWNVLSQN